MVVSTSLSYSIQCRDVISLAGKTTAAQSLFVYGAGSNHDSFFDPSFEPQFERPPTDDATLQRVTRMCHGIKECIGDYLLTGKLSLALGSADAVRQHEEVVEAAKTGSHKVFLCQTEEDQQLVLTFFEQFLKSIEV